MKNELQSKLDVEKWLDSESSQTDKCGEYEYCVYCDISLEYPCAEAWLKMKAVKDADLSKPEPVVSPFVAKLTALSKELAEAYVILDEKLTDAGFTVRRSQTAQSYLQGKKTVAKITLTNSYIKLFLALDPTDKKWAKIPLHNYTDSKTHAKTPLAVTVASPMSVRRAIALIDALTE